MSGGGHRQRLWALFLNVDPKLLRCRRTDVCYFLILHLIYQMTNKNGDVVLRRCDADPTALAKYIVALIKKDKPEALLRETCTDQLDVFLQESESFWSGT